MPQWAASLEGYVNKQLLVMLRDGREVVGYLRSYDQYANLLLEHAGERHVLREEKLYADVYLGSMLIRGENVALIGEVSQDLALSGALREAPLAHVLAREEAREAEEIARNDGKPLHAKPSDVFF